MRRLRDHGGPVRCLAYAPDGRTLACAGESGALYLWDLAADKPATWRGHAACIDRLAFAPDGSALASADWNGTVRLWDMPAGRGRGTAQGFARLLHALAVVPDDAPTGRVLAAGSTPTTLRVWDLSGGSPQLRLSRMVNRVDGAAFSPCGRAIATSSEFGVLKVWDADSGTTRALLRAGEPVRGLAFAPCAAEDPWTLAIAGSREVQVWDVTAADDVLPGEDDPAGWVASQRALVRSARSTLTAVAFGPCGRLATGDDDGTVTLWRLAGGRAEPEVVFEWHAGRVNAVAFGPDGLTAASAGNDHAVVVWDL